MLKLKEFQDKEDKELLAYFYADNNNEWLGILLQRYTILLFGVCMKYLKNEEEAKDCVQQVFLKVLHELPKYKVEYFKSWLYMVTKNHCLMKLRSKGHYTSEINDQVIASPQEPDLASIQEKEKLYSDMETAIHQLNKEQQVCISMFYIQKKSYQQIAHVTGYNLMQVKSHIQNGKRNLKILLERTENEQ